MPKLPADVQLKESGGFKDKFWVPRIWNGMKFSSFVRLLAQNYFLIDPYRWPMAAINLFAGGVTSSLKFYQSLTLDSKIQATELKQDPVFIIGH
ncbi:MAG: hypothetical protein Q4D62_16260, partial [Planctomycetia bacterium]|nr:hypothetical protein [Planctomycetia bacterium]